MATLRIGPQSIRDPALRSAHKLIQRCRFTGMVWSAPGRILYMQALCGASTPGAVMDPNAEGFTMEMETREALAFYALLRARLLEAGLVDPIAEAQSLGLTVRG